MNLNDTLRQIAAAANLNADELIAFAAEDTVGGRDTGNWPGMSTFAAEGQILYALVRALKPALILEVGVDSGGTTTHLLSALDANGAGLLRSIDIKADCGSMVPEHLRSRWQFTVGDGLIVDLPDQVDFIFEDGEHSYDFTAKILTRLKGLGSRVIVSHDYYSHEVYPGFGVKQGFDEVLPGGVGVKVDGAFTGLGVWVNPDWKAPEPPAEPEPKEDVLPESPQPPRRKAAKRG